MAVGESKMPGEYVAKMGVNSPLSSGRGMVLFDREALEGGVRYELAGSDCLRKVEGPGTASVWVDLSGGKSCSEKMERKERLLQLGMGCQGCEQGGARVNTGCGEVSSGLSREESCGEDIRWTRVSLVKASMVSVVLSTGRIKPYDGVNIRRKKQKKDGQVSYIKGREASHKTEETEEFTESLSSRIVEAR